MHAGCGWEIINDIPYPQYDIRYVESKDGLSIEDSEGISCLKNSSNEYRIGRPRVQKQENGSYLMRFTSDTYDKNYSYGLAHSDDGINWNRSENNEIFPSQTGWDSEMVCYPVEIQTNNDRYLFYSGNAMGLTGVGFARWMRMGNNK